MFFHKYLLFNAMKFFLILNDKKLGLEIMRSLREQYVFTPTGQIIPYKIEMFAEILSEPMKESITTISTAVDRYIEPIPKVLVF